MTALITAIIALAKAVPAMEQFLASLMEAYKTYKQEQNQRDETNKNNRDDALIDDAIARMPKCPTCGAPIFSRRQHHTSGEAPAVPSSSGSSS